MRINRVFAACIMAGWMALAVQHARAMGTTRHHSEIKGPIPVTEHPDINPQVLKKVHTDPGAIPLLKAKLGKGTVEIPLEHTHVQADVTGYVARVEVTQRYTNPHKQPIEAIYVFPLPENSAVNDMQMKIGDRTIRADIKKRHEARHIYDKAKAQGHTAALLEQERPNIFTQSVANIAPGHAIEVVITYLQMLTYDAGEYEFVFPMVVGPRFIPGQATGQRIGSGWSEDTTEVADASRITPPVLGQGERSGHDISLDLRVSNQFPLRTFNVLTHDVDEHQTDDGSLHVSLAKHDSIPNRDFIVKYAVDGKQPTVSLLTHQDDRGGFFSLVVHPPTLDVDRLVGTREIIFVVDISGSMSGVPLAMCKTAMEEALGALRPVDTFNIITFAGRTGKAFEQPRAANQTAIKHGLNFINGMRAGGGTFMAAGVDAALSPPVAEGRHRYVVFLTDGYVGNEKHIFAGARDLVQKLKARGQRARVFGFGVGSSVNRHLLDGLAKAGNGISVYSSTRDDPAKGVNQFFRYIDHPVISDLEIDWGGMQVEEIYPAVTPDLFASRPVMIHGRYSGSGEHAVRITGKKDGRKATLTERVSFGKPRGGGSDPLASLWARQKVASLTRSMWAGHDGGVVEEITQLGLDFRLVTAYTSFVAVDTSTKVAGEGRTIVVPVETPEGVDGRMAGAVPHHQMKHMKPKAFGFYGGSSGSSFGLGCIGARAGRGAPSRLMAPSVSSEMAAAPSAMDAGGGGGSIRAMPRKERRVKRSYAQPAPPATNLKLWLKQRMPRLQSELKKLRKADGSIPPKVKVKLFITRTGKIIQLRIMDGGKRLPDVEKALLKVMALWRWPTNGVGSTPVEFIIKI